MIKAIMESIFLVESLKSAKEYALKNNIPQDIFDTFNELDTTSTKKLVHQLLKWCTVDGTLKEKIEEMKPKIETFIKFSGKKIKEPIEQFKSYEDFVTFITPFLDVKTKAQKKDDLSGQYKKMFENEHMLVVLPYTHTASCIYGAGTTWCTTAKEATMFNSYIGRGCTIYYILNKDITDPKDPMHKMSLVIEKNGYISQHVNAINHMEVDKITKFLTDNGCDLKMFISRPDVEEREAAKVKELKHTIDVKYKKLESFVITNPTEYALLCKNFNIDEIFPKLKELNIGDMVAQVQIPKSVTSVIIGEYSSIRDLKFINNGNIHLSMTLLPGTIRTFTNYNNIDCAITFRDYADYYNESVLQKIKDMLPGFRSFTVDTEKIMDYHGSKPKVVEKINKIVDDLKNSTPTPVDAVPKKRVRKPSVKKASKGWDMVDGGENNV